MFLKISFPFNVEWGYFFYLYFLFAGFRLRFLVLFAGWGLGTSLAFSN